ncbi:MAG TPA: cation:proton antiporter [Chitinophagales bacterium]|nr:cation:proton antiporter [Chitinophagales bacterium]
MEYFFVIGLDPAIVNLAVLSLVIILLSLLIKRLKQPYVIAYILAGVLVGPYGFRLLTDEAAISNLGSLGLIFLLFFVGTEISVPTLAKNFKKPLMGAIMQVALSLLFISLLGFFMKWSLAVVILLSFVISLSSSAVIFRYLRENNELNTDLGQLVSAILLIQDIIIVPMLVFLNFMGSRELKTYELAITSAGGILILLFLRLVVKKSELKLPFPKELQQEHELQVFAGLFLCFGFSLATSFFGLSAALGAFLAGVLVSQAKATHWLQQSLMPFQVFFMALFFVSVGLMLDLNFLVENLNIILGVLVLVFLINSLINSLIFKLMGVNWRNSIYAGALLSQIGEFSFVLTAVGYRLHLIGDYSYQFTLSVIALTMLMTSIWINIIKIFVFKEPSTLLRILKLRKSMLSRMF